MTVKELEENMSLSEFTGWMAYLEEKNRQMNNGRN
jgi:hypothetical protein